MPEPGAQRKFEPRPASTQSQEAKAPANNDKGWTAEEEAFFAQGEARTRAAEAEAKRREEQKAYDATQAKIKELKSKM